MQLTKLTDLALRVILQLARVDGMATTGLAAAVGAADDDLEPILGHLRRLGLVEGSRGDRARLAPGGRGVSIGWIARALEGSGEVVDCDGGTPCPFVHGCRLRTALHQAQEAFFRVLDPITVDDVARNTAIRVEILPIGAR